MNQSIPIARESDVQRIIDRDFADGDRATVAALLYEYGLESYESEPTRVRLAILKLSDGNTDQLLEMLKTAKSDYRDVLAWAEYPNYMRISASSDDSQAKQTANKMDWSQYQSWFSKI